MYKIMIVEDDNVISKIISEQLIKWGLTTYIVKDFTNVLEEFIKEQPHLLLLDIGLPFYNGYHWCTQIRNISKVPIVFLSSASDNMNIVMAINMGADDFIAKPFDLSVLVAKLQGILRRSYDFKSETNTLVHKKVILNLKDTTVHYEGKQLELTKNDFRILRLLMERVGNVVAREEIMQDLWESDAFIDDNTLTVNIARLRKKLEEIQITDFIKTKKGMGYMIE